MDEKTRIALNKALENLDGYRVLGTAIPKSVTEIEKTMLS